MRWMIRNNLHHRFREWSVHVEKRRIALIAVMNRSVSKRTSRK
jgi:hypothetical protein